MTWFKIDDSFYDHPKVFDAPDCAVALWTRAGAWSARNLTEGFVPTGMPARLCDDPDTAVKELLRRGLWLRTSGGYRFHDWGTYQPSKESVQDLRAKRAEAGRLGGLAKAARRSRTVDDPVDSGVAGSRRAANIRQHEDDPAMWNASGAATRVPSAGDSAAGHAPNPKRTASNSQASASPDAKQNATPTRPDRREGRGQGDLPGGTAVTHASPEPPTRCPRHIDDPEPPPCGPCADARRAHDRWELAEAQRRRTAPRCRRHRGQPADNCGLCRAERIAAPDPEPEPAGATP
jgi:hypothetical protein